MAGRMHRWRAAFTHPMTTGAMVATAMFAVAVPASGQGAAGASASAQQIDEAYTAKIKEFLQDPRITTELVDHLPASATVPTPLKFHGRIVGTPGELTYAKDIHRYFEALDKASPRAKYLDDRQDRRRARHGRAGHRRRGHHRQSRHVTRGTSRR